jgi:hypothetical protein
VAPSGELVSSARAWTSTMGSLSTYTMRDSGAMPCATWCVLLAVGMPVPMSRNWRMPASRLRYATARRRNRRFSIAAVLIVGKAAATASPDARSAAKLSLPPSQ